MTGLDLDDILHHGFDEFARFVNPLIAARANLAQEPTLLTSTHEGALVDQGGNHVEDFYGPQAFGHRNAVVDEALIAFLRSDAPSWYPSRVNPFCGRLARDLCARAGGHWDNVYFGCSGADAVEAAIKLARAATGRTRVIGLEGAYHGCSMGALSLMERGILTRPFVPLVPHMELIPFGDLAALEEVLARGDVAALVAEPIQGDGGVRALPEDFVEALCVLTATYGTLLVADEVQTGLGRTGRGFLASHTWPRRPDVVCLAKHLGGGIAPLSATLTRTEVFTRAYGDNFATAEIHNATMGCNALTAVAGIAMLGLVDDAIIASNKERGVRLTRQLTEALSPLSLFDEVRGEGMMLGIALKDTDHPWLSVEHFGLDELDAHSVVAPVFCSRLYRHGFFCFTAGHDWNVVRVQPRFDLPDERLDAFVVGCVEALEFLEEVI